MAYPGSARSGAVYAAAPLEAPLRALTRARALTVTAMIAAVVSNHCRTPQARYVAAALATMWKLNG